MEDLYFLFDSLPKPITPKKWSFSSLNQFSCCPRRWHLSTARFPALGGSQIPDMPNASSITGELVHMVINEFEAFRRSDEVVTKDNSIPISELLGKFNVRRKFLHALDKLYAEKLLTNPRCNAKKIKAKVSIDDCINKFKVALRVRFPNGVSIVEKYTGSNNQFKKAKNRKSGGELELNITDPPLIGYVDAIENGKILELKTGKYSEDHLKQAEFYGLLYWYKYSKIPDSIEIHYTSSDIQNLIKKLDMKDLEALDQRLRTEMSEVAQMIDRGFCNALPSVENCRYCSVRFACDEYWLDQSTSSLRLESEMASQVGEGTFSSAKMIDVEISEFPQNWIQGESMIGSVMLKTIGNVKLNIGRDRCPNISGWQPKHVRILGAVVRKSNGLVTINTSSATELFWNR